MNKISRYNFVAFALALVAAAIVGAIQPLFFTAENILNVSQQATPLIILAVGQMVPILTRGLDLSQGGVVVATSVGYALWAKDFGVGPAIILALGVGLVAGMINGLLIAAFEISPFIVTLGTGSILQGLALVAANGQPISDVPAAFSAPYYEKLLGVPLPIILAVVVALLLWFILEKMLVGRRIIAVGSNSRAAFLAGIDWVVKRMRSRGISSGTTTL